MEFSHLFSILAVVGAVLFFSAGFSLGLLKSWQGRESAEPDRVEDTEAYEAALRESAAREMAASETAARESAARQAAESGAAMKLAECEKLRAQLAVCQDATKEVARLRATLAELEHRNGNGPTTLPPAVVDPRTGATTFQGILGRLSKTKGMRAAVLGDGLGLPVASLGEQSESLAGFCGFISQAASKARDFLQLGSIQRIVIEDDRHSTLTACSVAETDLFLATLTSGPGPDVARMVLVLNDVKSFMSQRSRA